MFLTWLFWGLFYGCLPSRNSGLLSHVSSVLLPRASLRIPGGWLHKRESRGRRDGDLFFFQFGDQLLPLYTTTTCTLRGGGAWFEIHLLFFQTCPSCYLSVSVWVWPQEHNLGSGTCHYWSWMTVAAQERTQVSFYHYQGCLLVLYVCLLSCFSTTHNDHEVETMS